MTSFTSRAIQSRVKTHPTPPFISYPTWNMPAASPRQSVDVVITSPPYLNNYHYIRNTRPQLFWLGLVSETSELKTIERKSFGQFWQTVRSGPEIALIPHLPHLADQIHELRGLYADKGPYGGPGWANYAASYFNDCLRFCQATKTAYAARRPGRGRNR